VSTLLENALAESRSEIRLIFRVIRASPEARNGVVACRFRQGFSFAFSAIVLFQKDATSKA